MRLIDADKLTLSCWVYPTTSRVSTADYDYFYSKADVDEAPTIDAEPAVRCMDCKYWELQSIIPPIPYGYCHYLNDDGEGFDTRRWNADDFCSRGVRK